MSTQSEYKAWPQYVSVFTALLAMFCSGIHFGWPSPSLPRIFSDEYPFNVTEEEGSYITIIGPIGDLFGNIIYSQLVDSIGRKFAILLIGLPQIISMIMIYCSTYSKVLLYVARFIGGISEGACFTILPLYICEVAESRIRGLLGASFSLILILGTLFANVVGSYCNIYDSAMIFLSFSVLFLVSFSVMPESPYFLLMKNRMEDARRALKKLRACDEVEDELETLSKDVERQMSEKGRFKDLVVIKSNRNACIVMLTLRLLQQFSGVSSFTIYAQLLFKEATDAIPEEYAAMLMIGVQVVATLVAVLIVDVIGRKPMVLISVGGCCLALFLNGAFFTLRDLTYVDVAFLNILPLVGLILFIICFALGLGSAVNLLLGELFPATVKAKAAAMMNMVFALAQFASTKFYQYMTDNYTLMIPFTVFAFIELVGFVVCWKFVPETKNKSLEQIQQELKGNRDKK